MTHRHHIYRLDSSTAEILKRDGFGWDAGTPEGIVLRRPKPTSVRLWTRMKGVGQ